MSDIDTLLDSVAALQHPHLFPLSAGSRRPPYGLPWADVATQDPREISNLAAQHPGCNWGIATGPSNLLVVDVDDKEGKTGSETLRQLEQEHGTLPKTFAVRTTTGGRHLYFRGTARSSVQALGRGLDTRGIGGYVVAPGSTIQDRRYEIIDASPPAPLPEWIALALQQASARVEDAIAELDEDHAVLRAMHYLDHEEPAIEGDGGDTHTYRVCCRVRDFGISQNMALDLLLTHFNDRCEPPWSDEELEKKVENAYKYSKNTHGCADPTVAFQPVPQHIIDALPGPKSPPRPKRRPKQASQIDPSSIPPRQWVLGHRLIRGYVSLLVAPGGVGKSIYTIAEALAVASGEPITGDPVHRPGPVLLLNTEDPEDEMERKLAAAAIYYGDRPAIHDALQRIHYLSSLTAPMRLVRDTHDGPIIDEREVEWIIDYCIEHRIRLIVIDPLIRLHAIKENDNAAMDIVTAVLARIAHETSAAILLCHHTRKLNDTQGAGDAETARGASSLVTAARIAATLSTMQPAEAERLGIAEDRRWRYLRLDDAKQNLAPPATAARWLARESVDLGQGDSVGVIRPVDPGEMLDPEEAHGQIVVALKQLAATTPSRLDGSTMVEVADILYAEYGVEDLSGRNRARDLRSAIGTGVRVVGGARLHAAREQRGGRQLWVVRFAPDADAGDLPFVPIETPDSGGGGDS